MFRICVFANPGAALLPTEAAYAAGIWEGFSKPGPVRYIAPSPGFNDMGWVIVSEVVIQVKL